MEPTWGAIIIYMISSLAIAAGLLRLAVHIPTDGSRPAKAEDLHDRNFTFELYREPVQSSGFEWYVNGGGR